MGSVNFYLKAPERVSGKSLIYLKYKFNGRVLVFTFGQSIDPANWNKAKQRVKSNKQTTEDGQHSLNELLNNLATVCSKAYTEALKSGIPSTGQLKQILTEFLNQNKEASDKPDFFQLADRFINGEIKNRGKKKSSQTLRNYQSVITHLKDYQAKKKYRITFESITLDFFYSYTSFLSDVRKLSTNTIAQDISVIKVIMGEAVDLGYTTNMQFKHKKFSYSEEETEQIYLTEQELHKLYKFKIQSPRLEQVRDLFVFGAWVGLRYSDYSNIKPENIVDIDGDMFIKMKTQKTKELVIIPCNPVIMEIFKKYAGNANKLPKAPSNQKFNEYIKEACKVAGMTITGRLNSSPDIPLNELISSHTARRSFATNYYLQGFPTIDLMKITGHKTESAFLKYIRVSKLDTAKRLSKHIKKNWSEKILRVA